jgi:hypothetical protein
MPLLLIPHEEEEFDSNWISNLGGPVIDNR